LVIRVLIKVMCEDRALLLFRRLGQEPTGFAAKALKQNRGSRNTARAETAREVRGI
jgi:hypothetical protein